MIFGVFCVHKLRFQPVEIFIHTGCIEIENNIEMLFTHEFIQNSFFLTSSLSITGVVLVNTSPREDNTASIRCTWPLVDMWPSIGVSVWCSGCVKLMKSALSVVKGLPGHSFITITSHITHITSHQVTSGHIRSGQITSHHIKSNHWLATPHL